MIADIWIIGPWKPMKKPAAWIRHMPITLATSVLSDKYL